MLNVGPRADGTFPDESVERLVAIGRWMRINGTAIYGSTASPFPKTPFRVTSQPRRLNLYLKEWASTAELPGLKTPIARAYLMADASRTPLKTAMSDAGDGSSCHPSCSTTWPVVVVEFESEPEVLGR